MARLKSDLGNMNMLLCSLILCFNIVKLRLQKKTLQVSNLKMQKHSNMQYIKRHKNQNHTTNTLLTKGDIYTSKT